MDIQDFYYQPLKKAAHQKTIKLNPTLSLKMTRWFYKIKSRYRGAMLRIARFFLNAANEKQSVIENSIKLWYNPERNWFEGYINGAKVPCLQNVTIGDCMNSQLITANFTAICELVDKEPTA